MLCVPNWSEGRNPQVTRLASNAMNSAGVRVHFNRADADHNRLVTAFSGATGSIREALFGLCEALLPLIDLRSHRGAHPRIGALDVCPFVLQKSDAMTENAALQFVEGFAAEFADRYEIPVLLYEESEKGRHAADLPTLRKGGFEAAIARELPADFGPTRAHPRWGATIMGLRQPLLAVNAVLPAEQLDLATELARRIRASRNSDPRFKGIRAIGAHLPQQRVAQVSMNFTKPDETSVDEVVDWLESNGAEVLRVELIGVVRESDLRKATRLQYDPEQVVEP
jgi:glutamate formiminotransferase